MTHVQKETAQLLKEKGFDLPSRQYFIAIDNKIKNNQNNTPYNWNKIPAGYSAPLLYEACIWLRSKGVHVSVRCMGNWYDAQLQDTIDGEELHDTGAYDTHDLALESGIVHALKHYVR